MTTEFVLTAAAPRATHDLYYTVHKGIRHAHGRMLDRIATADVREPEAARALADAVASHVALCRSHLAHEDAEIHTAIEARVPGASEMASHQHGDHERSFVELAELAQALASADPAAAPAAQRALYRRFVLFMAHDFEHMDGEEYALQPILQAYFTDEELMAIEHRIVSAIPEQEMVQFLRPMLAAASVAEREAMLSGMKAGMPEEVFSGLLTAVVGTPWSFGDWKAFDRISQ